MIMVARLFAILLVLGNAHLFAADPTNAPIQDLGDGRLQLGDATIDPKTKSLTFPAQINMTAGVVEYLIVHASGKVHESLLRTQTEPFHIHTAMLLLGVTNATNIEATAFFDAKRQVPGRPIKIDISLPGSDTKNAIQNYLAFAESKRPLSTNDIPSWIYNGSRFSDTPGLEPVAAGSPPRSGGSAKENERVFMAQREGSIVSLIADPSALVNNPRKDRENDELWILHTPVIPPVGTPVQVTFTLLPP